MEFEGFLKAAMSGPMRKGNWSSQRKEVGARASKRPVHRNARASEGGDTTEQK